MANIVDHNELFVIWQFIELPNNAKEPTIFHTKLNNAITIRDIVIHIQELLLIVVLPRKETPDTINIKIIAAIFTDPYVINHNDIFIYD